MKTPDRHGAEQARKRFSTLVERAARGEPTIITKRGKDYAALVPASYLDQATARIDLCALRGSGKGLWGVSVERSSNSMRDEWR